VVWFSHEWSFVTSLKYEYLHALT